MAASNKLKYVFDEYPHRWRALRSRALRWFCPLEKNQGNEFLFNHAIAKAMSVLECGCEPFVGSGLGWMRRFDSLSFEVGNGNDLKRNILRIKRSLDSAAMSLYPGIHEAHASKWSIIGTRPWDPFVEEGR